MRHILSGYRAMVLAPEGGGASSFSAQADAPLLSVADVSGAEDGVIALQVALEKVDPGEALSLVLAGLPAGTQVFGDAGATAPVGVLAGDGSVTLLESEMGVADGQVRLWIRPPADLAGTFAVTATAISTEIDGSTASATADFTLTVDAVAGDVSAQGGFAAATLEDQALAVAPQFRITDADGSETLGAVTLVSSDADMAGVTWWLDGVSLGQAVFNAATNRYELTLPADALVDSGNGVWSIAGLEAVPAAHSSRDVDFALLVETIDGGQSASKVIGDGRISVLAQADAPVLSAAPPVSAEGSVVPLSLSAALGDLDGSESFSALRLRDIPADWIVRQNGITLTAGANGYVLDAALLGTVTVEAPADFGAEAATILRLEAVVTDTDDTPGGSDSRTVTLDVPVTILPVADVPSLVVRDARGQEDGEILLDIRAAQTDADGSEALSLIMDNVPAGAVFRQNGVAVGTDLGGGRWSFDATVTAALATFGLTIVPPADSNAGFTLSVTLVSQDGGSTASACRDLAVEVRGVADTPLGLPADGFAFTGMEDQAVALDLSALAPRDADGSERLSVVLGGLPAGFQLTVPAGYEDALIYAGPNRWIVAPSALGVLSLVPPADFSGSRSFTADVIVTESDGAVRVDRRSVSVAVDGVADAALITLDANGTEDAGTPFALSISVSDGASATDPAGETVTSVIIDGLPAWATLTHPTIADLLQPLGNGAYQVDPATLGNLALLQQLQVLLPEDFGGAVPSIGIHVTIRDSNGDSRVTDWVGAIQVAAVADIAVSHDAGGAEIAYALADVHGASATGIVLPITATSSDDDGSETLSYEIAGVPEGVLLSHGSNLGGGVWHVTATQYAQALAAGGLTASVPNASAWGLAPATGFTLSVRAVSHEANGSLNGDAVASLTVTWDAGAEAAQHVADPRTIATDFSGAEDNWIALNLTPSGADLDGGNETVDVVVTGLPAGARLNHGSFDVSTGSWVLSPADLADLAVLPPHNFSGDMSVGVRVIVTEAGGDVRTDDFTVTVHLAPVSDAAIVSAQAQGLEDQPVALTLSVTPGDTTGVPETITAIRIHGVPAGASLSAGTKTGDGTWSLTPVQLAGLTLTPPAQWSGTLSLGVEVTSQDGAADPLTVTRNIDVTVTPVADTAMVAQGQPSAGAEDTAITLDLSLIHADTDGSEVVSVMISGLPDGSVLSAGIRDEQGNWLLTPSQLAGLTVRPPADWSGTLELTVTATSLERGSGAVSSVSLPVTVQVAPVADKPVSDPVDVTTDEDVPVALSLHLAASDDSETVGARIAGVPAGATFTRDGQPVGTLVATADGTATWLIDAADVAGLTLVPPPNGKGTWTFEVTPVSSDGASTRDGEASPLVVHVNPVSDAPTLSVTGASGNEDTRIPLDVRASLTDASEVLTATISDIPSGASLWWNGTRITVTNGVATLNAAQLSGLSLSIQPRGNSDVDFVLRVQAFSRDGGASPAHSQEVLLPVTVLPVSDLPNIPANALSDDEDSRIVLPTATLADTDGSETLTEVVISGIPDGATLRSGETVILVTNGTALLPIGLRANLTLQTKQDYSGSFSITYSATSQDGTAAPATRTRVIPVTVRPVSDLPTLDVQPAEGLEDTRIPLAISAAATDIDGSETLSVSISDIPTGSVLRSGETVIAIVDGTATLTSDQLAGLTIQPPPDHETDFTLTVRAISTDGSAAPAVTLAELPVNVIPVNDAPGLIALSNATVAENAAGATIGTVAVSDPDTGDSHTFSLSDDRFEVADGQLKLKAGQSLDHEAEPTVTLSITATDIAGLSNTQTFSLTVTDVNEAPVLDPSASPAFAAIFENAVDPQGGTVAAMIVDGSITDPDGLAVEAIAVVGMTGNGTWQYWTGSAWTAVGAVGENNALLLDAADRMRFIPAANWSGTAGISFRAWDKSAGTAHTYADVTAYGIGGSTPFSVASDTATLEVARLPRLSISDVSVQEGSTAILTLVFDQVPTSPVTVTWSSADGSATAASGDYQIASGTITFAAGETSKTITVLTHDDGVSEGSETVLVNLTGVSGAVVADGQGVITLSDAPAPIYWMDDLTNGLTGYTLYTNTPVRETYLGQSTQYLGDINGDGFGDFVASVYQEEGDWADLHVVTGSARGTRAALTEVRAAGFEIEAGAQQGIETATAADVDGDGTRELVLGVTGWVNGYWAKAYVLDNRAWSNGVPANSLLAGGGYTVGVPSSAPSYGAHMEFRTIGRGYGDFNGDGRDDFVGSEGVTNTSYGTYAGATAVVFGQTGTTSVASLTGSNGFEVFGSQAGEESGYAAQFIGDINGDGYDDVLIGAPGYDADGLVDAGRAMVVFGRSGAMPSAITPEWLNGSNGFTISGPVTAAASLGWWISELGDVNGDGVADFAMNGGGAVYVVYGHGGEWAPNLDLAQLDGTTGFRILGGGPVASAGDINGDGYDDIVISMQGTSDQSSQLAVVYGGRSMPAVFDPTQMEQGWGFRILGSAGDYSWGSGTWGVALGLNSGDVDGDGVADLMVGAPHNTAGGNTQVGNVHVVYGHTFLDSDVWAGTAGADLHTGTAGADKMVGDLGNDTLIGGGGADVLYGGNGADLLVVADDAFRRVDGGSGTDTLKFTGTTLDFTTLGDGRARGIEILDLAGNGGQSVRLSRDQVMDLADSGNVVTIDGDAADRVVLADAGWSRSATTDAAGYYTFSNGLAQVRVKGAQVALGNAANPAPTYWMSDLTNGLTGYTLYTNPPVSETYLGQSTQYLGDINGDGFGDFIASVYQEEGDWADLHVVTGGARGARPASTEVRAAGFEIEAGAQQGIQSASAADVDGDGTRELVLGVTGWVGGYWAKAYVLDNRPWGNGIAANSLLAGGGYSVAVSTSTTGDFHPLEFRAIGRGAGDFNGDGREDFVGFNGVADNSHGSVAGVVSVVLGQAGITNMTSLNGLNGFQVFGSQAGEESGYAAQFVGDINGDGYDDVLIGAPGYDADGLVDAGRAMVVFGRSGAMPSAITPEWLNGSNGFTISGSVTVGASLGWWIADLGDVNGDGVADFAIGGGTGVYVVYGHGGGWAPNLDLAQLDGTNGFRLSGVNAVANGGDINGDGYDDIVTSVVGTAEQGSQLAVVYGGRSMPAVFDPTQMEQGWGFRILGSAGDYSWGSGTWGVALGLNSGDVDGDGVADLMVGAPHNTAGGNTQVGNVHVVYGHTFLDSDVWAGTAGADLHAGTAGADKMVGDLGNDTLIGGGGADVLYGGNGADLLVVADDAFRRVDGGSGTDTLKFTGTTLDFTTLGDGRVRGIEILDLAGNGGQSVRLSRDQVMDLADSGNVVTIDGDAADRVVLADAGWNRSATADAAGYYTFSNGLAQVRVKDVDIRVAAGTAGDDRLGGWSDNDTLIGGAGADTYVLEPGGGADTIDNRGRAADGDKVLFDAGVSQDQLWFERLANDLKISVIGSGNTVTIQEWFSSSTNHIQQFRVSGGQTLLEADVQNLVNAMAAFAPPQAGQTTLPAAYQEQLMPIIAANWN